MLEPPLQVLHVGGLGPRDEGGPSLLWRATGLLFVTHFFAQQRLVKRGRATILQLKKKVLASLLLKQRKDSLLVTWACQECLEE